MEILEKAYTLSRAGESFALATVVRAENPTSAKAGAKAIITADGMLSGWVGGSCAEPTVKREACKALRDEQPRFVRLCPPEAIGLASQEGVVEVALTCISGGTLEIYIEPQLSKPHLVAIGHLATTEALVKLSKGLGYPVTVMGLDASLERFPQADNVYDHIDLSNIQVTPNTYFVVASHGNYDEEALEAVLQTNAAYVALVASNMRAEAILQYLRDSELTEDQITRLKYPAGLDIGSVTPEEIALSILAEIVQLRRHRSVSEPHAHPQMPHIYTEEPIESKDPVCGMMVDVAAARHTTKHNSETRYFCSTGCQRSFEKEPENYLVE